LDFVADGRGIDWQAKTVASMHTEPAKRAGARRLLAFRRLWDELEGELTGSDLD
jgi:hypothetical protein